MLIKQFTGTTIDEILPQIREELGDDALILATRRVTKGGLGGFFGRETLEVTAAQGGSQEDIAEVNREAAERPGADLLDDDRAPFSRHLQGRLAAALEAEAGLDLLADDHMIDRPAAGGAPAASPVGAYSRGMDTPAPAPRPFAPGDQQRTQAIIDAARQAMRQAAAQSSATGATAMAPDDIALAAAAEARTRVQPPPWATSAPLAREDVAHAIADAGQIRPPAMPLPSAVRPAFVETAPVGPLASSGVQRPSWAPLGETVAPPSAPAPVPPAPPAPPAESWPIGHRDGQLANETLASVPAAIVDAPAPVVEAPVAVVVEPAPVAEVPVAVEEEDTTPAPALRPLVLLTDPQPAAGEHPAIRAARADLADAGVHERYLEPLIDAFQKAALPFADERADERADVRGLLREWISARLPVARDWKPRASGHTIVLVGQSGVGKTTTACKLAGRMSAAGLRVALIAAGRGSHQALEGHARRLGIDAVLAEDADALKQARGALSDRDIIIVDTAGRSHQDLAGIEDLAALIGPCKPDEVHLVLPVTAALADLGDVTRRFRIAGVNRVSVTKLDETKYHGNLVNFPLRVGKPLGFVADGTAVPSALRPADAHAIAEMLLP